MDIARPREDPFRDDEVHEPHHGALARLLLGDLDFLDRRLIGELYHLRRRLHPRQQLVDRLVGPVQVVEPGVDLRRRQQQQPYLAGRGERQVLLGVHIEGVGGRDLHIGVRHAEGEDPVAPGERFGDHLADLGIDLGGVRDLHAEARGELGEDLLVGTGLIGDEGLPQRLGGVRLPPQLRQALRVDQALQGLDQPLVGERRFRHRRSPKPSRTPGPVQCGAPQSRPQKSRVTSNAKRTRRF